LLWRSTTDHGGWSIGTWLISHDGSHVTQYRKASVSLPPTGSSTDGLIATDPKQPQTSPVADLATAKSGFRETAVAKMLGSEINRAMLEATRTVDRRLEP
jgi:hypothetical protein